MRDVGQRVASGMLASSILPRMVRKRCEGDTKISSRSFRRPFRPYCTHLVERVRLLLQKRVAGLGSLRGGNEGGCQLERGAIAQGAVTSGAARALSRRGARARTLSRILVVVRFMRVGTDQQKAKAAGPSARPLGSQSRSPGQSGELSYSHTFSRGPAPDLRTLGLSTHGQAAVSPVVLT